jgi:hypothetical protein
LFACSHIWWSPRRADDFHALDGGANAEEDAEFALMEGDDDGDATVDEDDAAEDEASVSVESAADTEEEEVATVNESDGFAGVEADAALDPTEDVPVDDAVSLVDAAAMPA